MGPVDLAGVDPTDAGAERSGGRRRLLVGAIGIGVVALMVALSIRWLRSGGARDTVKELAEAGAAALADVVVDELFPG